MPDRTDRIDEMCRRAMIETDPRELLELLGHMNELLASIIDDIGLVLERSSKFNRQWRN
jgi:division protein CdvB (Snf7/Vps24/ESCRT-III family)